MLPAIVMEIVLPALTSLIEGVAARGSAAAISRVSAPWLRQSLDFTLEALTGKATTAWAAKGWDALAAELGARLWDQSLKASLRAVFTSPAFQQASESWLPDLRRATGAEGRAYWATVKEIIPDHISLPTWARAVAERYQVSVAQILRDRHS